MMNYLRRFIRRVEIMSSIFLSFVLCVRERPATLEPFSDVMLP